ncbi:MAG: UDP-3-O-acylglucosamine N-acyltransferase [Actinobacteria bacterium ADurb.BinA094]|nr:MAG: UDP-3-O-acylglucosamine N-acyltransferase [Actinobacteria bacterium ADurb.BinA094]
MSATVAAIARFLEESGRLETLLAAPGDDLDRIVLTGVDTDRAAGPTDVTWRRTPAASATEVGAGLLICPGPVPDGPRAGHVVAVCRAPRFAMVEVLTRFFAELDVDREPVYADPGLAEMVTRNHSWVKNAIVGPGVTIAQHVTIGCSGMGYERDATGRLVRFPQLGGVLLEADVHVAAQATVQRGALGDTVLRRGAKVGPHVNVGHNVEVGEDALLTGHVQLGGSCRIGARAVIWQSAVIANGVRIGDDAVVGMCSCVRTDVGPGEVWAGNPARRLR